MKLAVIGAHGFIGSRIVESFHLGEGTSIVAISSHAAQHNLSARFAVDLRVADALDADALKRALSGCSLAVHALPAGIADLRRIATNIGRAASAVGIRRIIYISNSGLAVRGPIAARTDKTRTANDPLTDVASAHVVAERQFLTKCREGGVTAYVLQTPLVYGPRFPLIAEIATELRDDRGWLLGQGEGIFNGIYVDNLIGAVRLCLKTKSPAGESYLVSDAETVTWRQLYQTIARELDLSASRVRYVESPQVVTEDPRMRTSSVPPAVIALRAASQQSLTKPPLTAATKSLGYAPAVSFAEGVRLSCAWWRFAQGDFRIAA